MTIEDKKRVWKKLSKLTNVMDSNLKMNLKDNIQND